MSILIEAPNNNKAERIYIIETIIYEFLGLDYTLEFKEIDAYHLTISKDKSLIIKDHFFNKHPLEKSYLNAKNIPKEVTHATNELTAVENMPVIFGTANTNLSQDCIITNIDVFASAFFMLSRWEEAIITEKDKHERFKPALSLAVRQNFIYRPIVNEYVEFIWRALVQLGYNGTRKPRKFDIVLTHDVDDLRKWKSIKTLAEEVKAHLTKPITVLKLKLNYFASIFNYKNDPFNTFNYLMEQSESIQKKSHFFFIAGGKTRFENRYKINSKKAVKLIAKILEKGHNIGLHPSYNTYNNKNELSLEKEALKAVSKQEITTGRQHYLRFEVPTTWQIWNDLEMKWDSSSTYATTSGFSCGVCYPFKVFNVFTRKKLNLIEKPLIFMEASFIGYQKCNPDEMNVIAIDLMTKVKKYNGEFTVLWHNASFNTPKMEPFKKVYENIIDFYRQSI